MTIVNMPGNLTRCVRKISYAGYRFPPEVIHQAWLYLRFTSAFVTSRICSRSAGSRSPTRPCAAGCGQGLRMLAHHSFLLTGLYILMGLMLRGCRVDGWFVALSGAPRPGRNCSDVT